MNARIQWIDGSAQVRGGAVGRSTPRGRGPRVQWLAGPGFLGQRQTREWCLLNDPNFGRCVQDSITQAVVECSQQPGGCPPGFVDIRSQAIQEQICFPACEAYARGSQDYPWNQSAPETCAIQDELIPAMRAAGLCPISRDCKMGPATCGALNAVRPGDVPATCMQHQGEWVTPKRLDDPTCPTPGPVGPPPCPAEGCPPNTACNPATGNCDPVAPAAPRKKSAAGGALLIGVVLLGAIGAALAGRGGFTG